MLSTVPARLLAPLAAALALLAPPGSAHDARTTGLRHAHDLGRALELARVETRHVLVHARASDEPALEYLRWPDTRSVLLFDTLVLETVLCEVPARSGLPRLSLLGADGAAVWSHDGRLPLAELVQAVEPHLRSEDQARTIEARLARQEGGELLRERHAHLLAARGELDAAAAIHAELLAASLEGPAALQRGRRPLRMRALADLSGESGVARDAVDRLRGEIETMLRRTREGDLNLARDLGQWNLDLGQPERSVELFLELDLANRARHGLYDPAFEGALERGRYAELAAGIQPELAFRGEVALVERLRVTRPGLAAEGEGRGTTRFTIQRGVGLVEVLAGLGRDELAVQLAGEVLAFDDSRGTRALLFERLLRAGNDAVRTTLEERLAR